MARPSHLLLKLLAAALSFGVDKGFEGRLLMSSKKKSGWNAKPRTRLRYIKPGDLFMFRLDDSKHGVGRIISKVSLGHVAEFFEVTLNSPELQGFDLARVKRRGLPVVLDSYSLFDRKIEGD